MYSSTSSCLPGIRQILLQRHEVVSGTAPYGQGRGEGSGLAALAELQASAKEEYIGVGARANILQSGAILGARFSGDACRRRGECVRWPLCNKLTVAPHNRVNQVRRWLFGVRLE